MWSTQTRMLLVAGFFSLIASAALVVIEESSRLKTEAKSGDSAPATPAQVSTATELKRLDEGVPASSATAQPKPAPKITEEVAVVAPPADVITTDAGDGREPPCASAKAALATDNLTLRTGLLEQEGGADPSRKVFVGEAAWKASLVDSPQGCRLHVVGAADIGGVATATVTLVYGSLSGLPRLESAALEGFTSGQNSSVRAKVPRMRLGPGIPPIELKGKAEAPTPERLAVSLDPPASEAMRRNRLAMHWIDFFVTLDGVDFIFTAEQADVAVLLGRPAVQSSFEEVSDPG